MHSLDPISYNLATMRCEVYYISDELDGRGHGALEMLSPLTSPGLLRAVLVDVFLLERPIPEGAARRVFADEVAQGLSIDGGEAPVRLSSWDCLFEVSFKPGVTDTVALTAKEAIELELGADWAGGTVQSAVQYLVWSKAPLSERDIAAISKALHNPLIQNCVAVRREEWAEGKRPPALYPLVRCEAHDRVESIDIAPMSDAELKSLSRSRLLALSLDEMRAVRDWLISPKTMAARSARGLPRGITDVELEMVAQTWSEHCKHKIFNATIRYREGGAVSVINSLFKTYIKATTDELASKKVGLIRSVFKDNSGVIAFDEDTCLCIKAETHNSPSALDPYGGAITGIVGVNRDIMGTGKGARPLFNTNVLCFGYPTMPDSELPDGLLHPRDVLRGVHKGIVDGGNQSGIPTVAGAFLFDESFTGKPLVFCGTGGIMPAKVMGEDSWVKRIKPGHLAVMLGGRIGKDGIHGATFSSLELSESSPVSAVQIGDPIIQRKMTDFLLEARDQGFYEGITDNGAGGLSSSLGEMAGESGGIRIDLDACPLKYPGLAPWEILVSESQERMSLSVLPEKLEAFMALARRRGVEASVVGEFTDTGYVEIISGGKTVGLLDLAFLHDGLPIMELEAEWAPRAGAAAVLLPGRDLSADLLACLSEPNVASKEALVRQYDHEVQGISVEKPFAGLHRDAPSDGAVIKPRYDSMRGVTVTHGICPRYSDWDAYDMAMNAVDEAYRAHIALGGRPDEACALDNFCWPDPVKSAGTPDGPFKLAQLVRACRGLKDACVAYGLPLVSGKDSMKNDAVMGGKKLSVRPTLLVTLMGVIDDVRKAPSTDFLEAGDLIYVLGDTDGELGGSIYAKIAGLELEPCPKVRPERALLLYEKMAKAISGKIVRSCHDLSDGGLGVALAESCLGGRLGAEMELSRLPGASPRDAARLLFSESASRFLVSVRPGDRERFEATMRGAAFARAGVTLEKREIRVTLEGVEILGIGLDRVEAAFKAPIAGRA